MKNIRVLLLLLLIVPAAQAQSKKVTIAGGADLVSAYIWRGTYNAGASIQPNLSMNVAGFSLGAWGSTDFGGNGKKEVDLSVSYAIKGLRFAVTDYWWAGEGVYNYFRYSHGATSHLFEGTIAYQLPFEKFPLIASWNTIFAGADYNSVGDQNYSTYIELSYPFAVGSFDMAATVGFVPWKSPTFIATQSSDFSVCNVAIMASKAIKISPKFTLPLFSQLIFNPATEDIHLVFGVSLKLQ